MAFSLGGAGIGSILGSLALGPAGAIAGAAGGGGDIFGQLSGQSAISGATDVQNAAYQRAISGLLQSLQGTQAQWQPYQQLGTSALQQLQAPGGVEASPAYQFTLQQGLKNINAQAASRGQFFSPATTQALTGYTMGEASNYYQQAFQDLLAQTQIGQAATGAATGQTLGINEALAGLYTGQGTMQAQAGLAKQAGGVGILGVLGGIGGSIFGGPIGGMIGSSLGSSLGGGGSMMGGGGGGGISSTIGGLTSPYGYASYPG
jgi:hypothetical protein